MNPSTTSLTEEAIVRWLVEQIAEYLQVPGGTVRPTVPLADYGMDSVFTFALCADIEDRFGLPVEPTLAWDYPRIEQIARFLHHELAANDRAVPPPAVPEQSAPAAGEGPAVKDHRARSSDSG